MTTPTAAATPPPGLDAPLRDLLADARGSSSGATQILISDTPVGQEPDFDAAEMLIAMAGPKSAPLRRLLWTARVASPMLLDLMTDEVECERLEAAIASNPESGVKGEELVCYEFIKAHCEEAVDGPFRPTTKMAIALMSLALVAEQAVDALAKIDPKHKMVEGIRPFTWGILGYPQERENLRAEYQRIAAERMALPEDVRTFAVGFEPADEAAEGATHG